MGGGDRNTGHREPVEVGAVRDAKATAHTHAHVVNSYSTNLIYFQA
jgi:hypothetical protein